jgi:hypothetical protein
MEQDPELAAMTQVVNALRGLDERAIARVLKWASDRFNVLLKASGRGSPESAVSGEDNHEFEDLPTLYDAANPSTDSEKALVVGYWLQAIKGEENFETQPINEKLKNFGHPIGNITRAFDALKNMTPRLVHQIEKSGTSKQARKTFKVTVEGMRKVRNMIQQHQVPKP